MIDLLQLLSVYHCLVLPVIIYKKFTSLINTDISNCISSIYYDTSHALCLSQGFQRL